MQWRIGKKYLEVDGPQNCAEVGDSIPAAQVPYAIK